MQAQITPLVDRTPSSRALTLQSLYYTPRLDPWVTYHYDKFSCLKGAFIAHGERRTTPHAATHCSWRMLHAVLPACRHGLQLAHAECSATLACCCALQLAHAARSALAAPATEQVARLPASLHTVCT